jgi:hypothetical protein
MSIKLELEINEIDFILEMLGGEPYIDVVDLIAKIHQQGRPQVEELDTTLETTTGEPNE